MQYHHPRPGPQGKRKRVFTPAAPSPQEADVEFHTEDDPRTTRADVQASPRHLYPSQKLAPRSAYRYRPIAEEIATLAGQYGGIPMPDGVMIPQGDDEQWYLHRSPAPVPQRAGRSTQAPIPQQAASRMRETEPQASRPRTSRRPFTWLWLIGLAFLAMVLGKVTFSAFGSWWQVRSDDGSYGRPRTFQADAVVGHGDSPEHPSHFIALNLNRHVLVIELPGGDVSRSVIYSGPVLLGDGQDLTPVTLSFADRNGDGRPDMILHILDQQIVFLNSGTKFVPPSNGTDGGSDPPIAGG